MEIINVIEVEYSVVKQVISFPIPDGPGVDTREIASQAEMAFIKILKEGNPEMSNEDAVSYTEDGTYKINDYSLNLVWSTDTKGSVLIEVSKKKKSPKKKKYQVLSPDGFTIEMETPFYTSMVKAATAFASWASRYDKQGYYSSTDYGRIPLNELKNYCQFKTIET